MALQQESLQRLHDVASGAVTSPSVTDALIEIAEHHEATAKQYRDLAAILVAPVLASTSRRCRSCGFEYDSSAPPRSASCPTCHSKVRNIAMFRITGPHMAILAAGAAPTRELVWSSHRRAILYYTVMGGFESDFIRKSVNKYGLNSVELIGRIWPNDDEPV